MPRYNPALKIELPKWPAMTVSGSWVSLDQAAEIIIRTTRWSHGCNDKPWMRTAYQALGLETTPEYPYYKWEQLDRIEKDLGVLPLSYLYNSRVMSSWVGGPHGWMDWSGTVFSSNYNIGKWPTVNEVKEEWRLIADAFPYLDLRCQLWPGETEEMHASPQIDPLVEFSIKNGKVRVRKASPQPRFRPKPTGFTFMTPGGERGCPEQTLVRAIQLIRTRIVDGKPKPTIWDRLSMD